ncbi:MAG: response regulator transcription factor [Alphaproteobacteria bacterium]|nr:response regulator transcription factor [Alphaproteobacteria bacterium]
MPLADNGHVLVIDDDAKIAKLIKTFAERDDFTADVAHSAAEARTKLAAQKYDIMIVDKMMPGEDGISLIKSLRADGNNTPAIILTADGTDNAKFESLECGADDFLPKPFNPRELTLRMRIILKRSIAGHKGEVITFGPNKYDTSSGFINRNGKLVRLTTAEHAVLKRLVENRGELILRDDLAKKLKSEPRSVDVLITRIRKKIETTPKLPEFVHTIRHKGYRFITGE